MRARHLAPVITAAAVLAVLLGERARPLRARRESPWRRDARNLWVAVLGALAVQLVERPMTDAAVRWARRRRIGLHRLALPPAVKTVVALLWLDYGLYVWHVLLHREPLWRLHRAHHSDLELSASTAVRLHFCEMALSGPWRAAQAAVLGLERSHLDLWRRLTLLEIVFHHANLRLPARLDRLLSGVIVTPRMHGIHHSVEPDEVGSNWGTILTVWDRLHGTIRLHRPQPAAIGLPDKQNPRQVSLPRVLWMPFERRP